MRLARSLALARAGSSIAARIAMMAITTSNSIKVNPAGSRRDRCRAEGGDFGSACRFILVIGPYDLGRFVVIFLVLSGKLGGRDITPAPLTPLCMKITTSHVLFYAGY